jgi:hypothetical protein
MENSCLQKCRKMAKIFPKRGPLLGRRPLNTYNGLQNRQSNTVPKFEKKISKTVETYKTLTFCGKYTDKQRYY